MQLHTNRVTDVYRFTKALGKCESISITSAATAWNDPRTGVAYILIFHETLFYGPRLDHSLINPNNLRGFGVDYWDNPYDKDHQLCIEVKGEVTIPLYTKGTKVCFDTHKPSQDKLNQCPKIVMNSARPWNPQDVVMGQTETQRLKRR